jgi:hypothetical protein
MITGVAIDTNLITNTTEVLIPETEERIEVQGIFRFGQEVSIEEEEMELLPKPYWDEDEE